MNAEFAASCPKDINEPEANEDQFAFSDDMRRLGLCDGASESYDSRLWARMLSRKFADDPKFGPDWVQGAVLQYSAAHDFEALSWSRQLAFERGSFSTLLGIDHDPVHRAVDVLAVGDCVALLVDGHRLIAAWPFADPERFKEHPTLLATLPEHNGFLVETGFWSRSVGTYQLDRYESPQLYCLTDAIGEWALRQSLNGGDGLRRLASLTNQDDLQDLVTEERAAKRLRVDDSTLVILSFAS